MCDNPDPELLEKARSNPRLEPFIHTYYDRDMSLYDKFKHYIFPGPIFAFLRLTLFFLCLLLHHAFQRIVFLGYSDWENPAPKWRRRSSQFVTKFWSAIGMAFCGFGRLKFVDHTRENRNSDSPPFEFDQPYPLVGPHLSEIDILVCSRLLGNPSFAAKSEMFNTPLISFLTKCFCCFKIVRKEPNGEKPQISTTEILVNRIKNPKPDEYTPLVFPEGTTGSGRYVFRFHRGAFIAGKPVRPFTIKYPGKHVSLSYDSITIFKLMYDVGSQFVNRVELELYDVYYPSPEEQNDPGLYARNVGKFIAGKMGLKYLNNCDIKEAYLLIDYLNKKKTYEEVEKKLANIEASRIVEDKGNFND